MHPAQGTWLTFLKTYQSPWKWKCSDYVLSRVVTCSHSRWYYETDWGTSRENNRKLRSSFTELQSWQLWLGLPGSLAANRSSYLLMQGWCGHPATKRWWHYSNDTLVVFETPLISANIWTALPAWRQPTTKAKREIHTSSTYVYTICPVSVSQLPLLRHCGQNLTGLYLLNSLWWMKKWQPSL